MVRHAIGVDLGGHKIRVVVVETSNPLVAIVDIRIETPQEQGYEAVLAAIVSVIRDAITKSNQTFTSVGICTPGVLDPSTGLLKNSNTQCLNGRPLKADLEVALGLTVVAQNDANCFALAEDRFGAARGSSLTFGIIMGTGVGGGLVVAGQPRFGRQGIAGEWGHNLGEPGGRPCYCGRAGCVETVISGPSLEVFYQRLSGENCELPEICARAKTGDRSAQLTIDRLVAFFGSTVGPLINILDPDCVVLGGGVSNVEQLYTRGVAEVAKYVFNDRSDIQIVKNQLGDSAGVFGAAMLVL